jgi:hypothetical protein
LDKNAKGQGNNGLFSDKNRSLTPPNDMIFEANQIAMSPDTNKCGEQENFEQLDLYERELKSILTKTEDLQNTVKELTSIAQNLYKENS